MTSIKTTAQRVKDIMLAHPDVEKVDIRFNDLERKAVFITRPTDARTHNDLFQIALTYDAIVGAWKDTEAKTIIELNLALTQWETMNRAARNYGSADPALSDDIEKGLRDPEGAVYPSKLPDEMKYQVASSPEPEEHFGPFTPDAIAAANKEAKDRLWGAPTDHPVVLALRHQARDLMVNMLLNIEPSRRRSLALSDLEQSLMWAIKGVFEKKEN